MPERDPLPFLHDLCLTRVSFSPAARSQAEIDEDIDDITADLRQALRDRKRRGAAYMNLFSYAFFCIFYMVVVYVQSDVFNAFHVVSSVRQAFVPHDEDGLPLQRMNEPTEILDWLVDAAFPVWVNEVCGDGVCNAPVEYAAYGRFGCRPDCGVESKLTTMLLQVRADFRDDLYSPLALMSAASWNLCRRDEEASKAGYPDVCWWEEDRTFTSIKENHLETVNIPSDTLWFIRIEGDYMGRVVGSIFVSEGATLPWVGTVPEWKACDRNVVDRRAAAPALGRRLLDALDNHEEARRFRAETGAEMGPEGFRAMAARVLRHKRVETSAPRGSEVKINVTAATEAAAAEAAATAAATSRGAPRGAAVSAAPTAATNAFTRAAYDEHRRRRLMDHDIVPYAPPQGDYYLGPTPEISGLTSGTVVGRTQFISGDSLNATLDYDTELRLVDLGGAHYPRREMTWEAWVKPDSVGLQASSLMSVAPDGWSVMIVCSGPGVGCCGTHQNNAIGFWMGSSPRGVDLGQECASMPSSTTGVPSTTWSHVAITLSEVTGEVSFYLDGVLSGQHTLTAPFSTGVLLEDPGTGPVRLGVGSGDCVQDCLPDFAGKLDDVRVWNGRLPEATLMSYRNGMTTTHPNIADLRAHYLTTHRAMSTPYSPVFAPSDQMTFEAWVKPATGANHLMQSIAALGENGWRVMLMCSGQGSDCCGSHVANSIGFWTGDECAQIPSSSRGVPLGEWTHIAVAIEIPSVAGVDPQATFYINGFETNTVQRSGLVISNAGADDGDLTFGYQRCWLPISAGGGSNCLKYEGDFDDIRLWNVARDSSLIAAFLDTDPTPAMSGYSNLVLAYKMNMPFGGMDRALVDLSSSGLPPAQIETIPRNPRPASRPAAFYFSSGAHFIVDYTPALAPSDEFTFEAWVKPGMVVQQEVLAMLGNYGWAVMLMCTGDTTKCCSSGHLDSALGFYASSVPNADCAQIPSSNMPVIRGIWNHIAVTVGSSGGGKVVSFYINGAAAGSQSSVDYVIGNGGGTLDLTFGRVTDCASNGQHIDCMEYTGYMDNVRIFNRTLDRDTIAIFKDSVIDTYHPDYSSLISVYRFDDKSGVRVVGGGGVWADDDRALFRPNPLPLGGASAMFDGSTLLSVDYDSALAPSAELTFEAWIKPLIGNPSEVIVDMGAVGWGVMLICSDPERIGCCNGGNHVNDSVAFIAGQSMHCTQMPSSDTGITRGMWNHIAVTVEPTRMGLTVGKLVSFYINGNAAGQSASASYSISNGGGVNPLTFGGIKTLDCDSGYSGLLDVVRIWNISLGPGAVWANMDRHISMNHPRISNLVANYTFNDGSYRDMHTGTHNGELAPEKLNTFFASGDDVPLAASLTYIPMRAAAYFDGSDRLVTAPFEQPAGWLSFEAWIKPALKTVMVGLNVLPTSTPSVAPCAGVK